MCKGSFKSVQSSFVINIMHVYELTDKPIRKYIKILRWINFHFQSLHSYSKSLEEKKNQFYFLLNKIWKTLLKMYAKSWKVPVNIDLKQVKPLFRSNEPRPYLLLRGGIPKLAFLPYHRSARRGWSGTVHRQCYVRTVQRLLRKRR